MHSGLIKANQLKFLFDFVPKRGKVHRDSFGNSVPDNCIVGIFAIKTHFATEFHLFS